MATTKDLRKWMEAELCGGEDFSGYIGMDEDGEHGAFFDIFTERHHYSIIATNPTPETPLGGIGAMVVSGPDLTYGPFTRDTWNTILADIVATEIQPLRKNEEEDAA